jgi:hypothetical protein
MKTIGKCSLCGGAVEVPFAYFGTPPAVCAGCGAIRKNDYENDHLPTIPMKKPKPTERKPKIAKWEI